MREQLEEQTRIAEHKIRKALQEFHEAIGLVPISIYFEMVDVRTMEEHANGKRSVIVGQLSLRAST